MYLALCWTEFILQCFQGFGPVLEESEACRVSNNVQLVKASMRTPSSNTCHPCEKDKEAKCEPVTPALHEDLWVLLVVNPASGLGEVPVS